MKQNLKKGIFRIWYVLSVLWWVGSTILMLNIKPWILAGAKEDPDVAGYMRQDPEIIMVGEEYLRLEERARAEKLQARSDTYRLFALAFCIYLRF